MTPALLLAALLPGAEPANSYDLLLEVYGKPAVRVRLTIELDGKSLASLDAEAKKAREALKGKPGAGALARLAPEGSLLRAEALPAVSPHTAALSDALFKALDTDGDGKLSAAELAVAEKVLLGNFDHDDDECITPLELVPGLQTVEPVKGAAPAVRVSVVPVEGKADSEHAIELGRDATHWHGKVGGVWVELHTRPGIAAEKPEVPKALLAPGREEVKDAFEKSSAGVVSVLAVPGPVGLFDLLDADRDGQLSVAELRRAKVALANVSRTEVGVSLLVVPGVARPPAAALTRTFARTAGPEWFRALDKNGDGYVSRKEFVGTAEQFRKIDRDGDGLISPDEAERAGK